MESFSRRQEPHEVSRLRQLSILVYDSYCDDVIVLINLVHNCSHDTISLAVFDDLIILPSTSSLSLLWLLVSLHVFTKTWFLSSESPCHEQFAISLFALCYDVSLDLVFYLFSELLDQFPDEQFFNKQVNDFWSKNVPLVRLTLRILHVEWHEERFKILLFDSVNSYVHCNQASFLTLENI